MGDAPTVVRRDLPDHPRRIRLDVVAVVALYVGVVSWLTWPLSTQMATHLSAAEDATRFDALYTGWALAWESRALVTAPATLPDANIYHPTPHALFYGPSAFGSLPLFMPVFLSTGNPTLALNVMYLLSVALTAAALHLVVHRWTGMHHAGTVAAATFLTSRWLFWEWLPSAPQAAVLFYFPVIVLLAAAPGWTRRRTAILLGLVVAQCLVEITYVAPAVLAPLALIGILRVGRASTRASGVQLLVVVVLAVVALAPVLAGHFAVAAANPRLRSQTLWLSPQKPLVLPWGPIAHFTPLSLPPAVALLAAAGIGVRWLGGARGEAPAVPRRAWIHAAFWTAIGFAMMLTPTVVWNDTSYRLPQAWLAAWLPAFAFLRWPSRLGVAALIGVALLAGLAFAECTGLLRRGGRGGTVSTAVAAVAVVCILYLQYSRGFSWPYERPALPASYPTQAAIGPSEPLLATLRTSKGPLLELPLWLPGSKKPYLWAAAMYRSIFHRRPLLNGYSSYYPTAFPARMQLAQQLPAAGALAALRNQTGVTTILVHGALLTPIERVPWITAIQGRDDLRLAARDGEDLLFEVAPSPAAP